MQKRILDFNDLAESKLEGGYPKRIRNICSKSVVK